eukprot:7252133-Prymnesium_polylepis.1
MCRLISVPHVAKASYNGRWSGMGVCVSLNKFTPRQTTNCADALILLDPGFCRFRAACAACACLSGLSVLSFSSFLRRARRRRRGRRLRGARRRL